MINNEKESYKCFAQLHVISDSHLRMYPLQGGKKVQKIIMHILGNPTLKNSIDPTILFPFRIFVLKF